MSLRRRVSPIVSRLLTSPTRRALARRAHEARRALRGGPHRVEYFHQVDDPYAQLVAPLLESLVDRYGIELVPVPVGPPPDDAAPERDQLEAFSRRDAADVAPYYGVAFEDVGRQPEPELAALANAILIANLPAERFVAIAAAVGDALWGGDAETLAALAADYGSVDPATADRAIAAGNDRRRKLGHYLGATFHYAGEWYWGIERLTYLEERLRSLGLGEHAEPVVARRLPEAPPAVRDGSELTLEFFASLRSPYTAIAFEPVERLVRDYGIGLEVRPVLPMVMRGLPVPSLKRRYILLDTRREAERAGVAFGHMCDPVGRPVELGYSLFGLAREHGREFEWLHAFTRAAFAQGIDLGDETALLDLAEKVGLPRDQATKRLGNEDWRDELEANRLEMVGLGLWGVPSFRLRGPQDGDEFATWGQDRLWLVEQRVRARLGEA